MATEHGVKMMYSITAKILNAALGRRFKKSSAIMMVEALRSCPLTLY